MHNGMHFTNTYIFKDTYLRYVFIRNHAIHDMVICALCCYAEIIANVVVFAYCIYSYHTIRLWDIIWYSLQLLCRGASHFGVWLKRIVYIACEIVGVFRYIIIWCGRCVFFVCIYKCIYICGEDVIATEYFVWPHYYCVVDIFTPRVWIIARVIPGSLRCCTEPGVSVYNIVMGIQHVVGKCIYIFLVNFIKL